MYLFYPFPFTQKGIWGSEQNCESVLGVIGKTVKIMYYYIYYYIITIRFERLQYDNYQLNNYGLKTLLNFPRVFSDVYK